MRPNVAAALLLLCIFVSQTHASNYPVRSYDIPYCPSSPTDVMIYYTQDKSTSMYEAFCSTADSVQYYMDKNEVEECLKTDKTFPKDTPSTKDLCEEGLNNRRFRPNNEEIKYVEVARDQADADNILALCCPTGGLDTTFTTLDMAEPLEFPHYAKVGDYGCGGTVYNDRWIVTAAHCVTEYESIPKRVRSREVDTERDWNDCCAQIRINILISNAWTEATYNTTKIVVHPKSSYLDNDVASTSSFGDVALIQVDRKIKFGEHVKALKLAPKGFEPRKYHDSAIIIGFGTMDTGRSSPKLQKANVVLRDKSHIHNIDEDYKYELIFVGGTRDGNISSGAGKGDSGGPAMCRDANGMAILCGITSFTAASGAECLKNLDEEHCPPSSYNAVEYFNEWIESVAGPQKEDQLLQQPFAGKAVTRSEYPAHVHLIPSDGSPTCGGTMIGEDILVTAATCVLSNPTTPRASVKVAMGVLDLKKGGGTMANVINVAPMPDFKEGSRKVDNDAGRRKKRVVNVKLEAWQAGKLQDGDIMSLPYYENNLVLVKIDKKVTSWAKLATKSPKNGEMGMEVAYPTVSYGTESNGAKPLTKRQFKLLDTAECQRRLNLLKSIGYNYQVERESICGVEWYSGGNRCDRELGGGLYCKQGGEQVLCGVQTNRWCEFSVPNEFKDIAKVKDWWLNGAMESLEE